MQVLGTANVEPRCSWRHVEDSLDTQPAPRAVTLHQGRGQRWPEVRDDPGSGVLHNLAAIIPCCYTPGESCPFSLLGSCPREQPGQEMVTDQG